MPADGSALVAGPEFRMWLGTHPHEAAAAYGRARRAGLSLARALVVGQIASFRDGWAFRRTLARVVGISVRTVQRAITQAKAEGLIGVARCKQGESPPRRESDHHRDCSCSECTRARRPLPCGWSHRWTIGWGKAGAAVTSAIAAARAKRAARTALGVTFAATRRASSPIARTHPPRVGQRWTAEALDAELARRAPTLAAAVLQEHKPPRDGPTR